MCLDGVNSAASAILPEMPGLKKCHTGANEWINTLINAQLLLLTQLQMLIGYMRTLCILPI